MPNHHHIDGSAHLGTARLLDLANANGTHPHLDNCAFCREQYEALIAIARFVAPDVDSAVADGGTGYRLAAHSETETQAELLLRQTWYLDGGNVLLRVFEERAHDRLVAYVICDPQRLPLLSFRFSGVDGVFHPAHDGSFVIGGSDIDIEPMTVSIDM
ncbi:MAG: hypothetical protein M5R41_05235 [Bacteroidia bacterium]|nr:hypothetical protein [Bacteroidia bacterium]